MWSTSADRSHETAISKGFWREADRSLHITQRFTCHAHLHGLVSDTAWNRDGREVSIDGFDSPLLSRLFQHRVLEMMVARHRLSPEFAQKLRAWSPSGFGVYCSRAVPPEDRPALERLAAYLLRPSFAASRLHYDPEQGRIEYRTAKGVHRCLDALDWIALVTSHIPNSGEQMNRYYGRYSNASRGKRRLERKRATVSTPCPELDSEENSPAEYFSQQRRRSWARLLRKIYEVDPLKCPKSGSRLQIIAVPSKAV